MTGLTPRPEPLITARLSPDFTDHVCETRTHEYVMNISTIRRVSH